METEGLISDELPEEKPQLGPSEEEGLPPKGASNLSEQPEEKPQSGPSGEKELPLKEASGLSERPEGNPQSEPSAEEEIPLKHAVSSQDDNRGLEIPQSAPELDSDVRISGEDEMGEHNSGKTEDWYWKHETPQEPTEHKSAEEFPVTDPRLIIVRYGPNWYSSTRRRRADDSVSSKENTGDCTEGRSLLNLPVYVEPDTTDQEENTASTSQVQQQPSSNLVRMTSNIWVVVAICILHFCWKIFIMYLRGRSGRPDKE